MSVTAEHSHQRDPAWDRASHNAHRRDPTRTTTISKEYGQALRGELGRLNAAIRDGIQSRDIFGLSTNVQDPPVFRFERDDQKIDAFLQWLQAQLDRGLLEIITAQDNTYIRAAYNRGLSNAGTELNRAGITVFDPQTTEVINTGVHQEALQRLFTRNFRNLEGITAAMGTQISRELANGFAQGLNPTETARQITNTVDEIGKRRATVLARTETIRAHTEAALLRYERAGVDEVTVRAEWLTARDDRVCPICKALEGEQATIQEAREGTVTLGEEDVRPHVPEDRGGVQSLTGEFPLRPPAHPACRCTIVPVN